MRSLVQVVLRADTVKVAWEDRKLDKKEVNNDIANWFMHRGDITLLFVRPLIDYNKYL